MWLDSLIEHTAGARNARVSHKDFELGAEPNGGTHNRESYLLISHLGKNVSERGVAKDRSYNLLSKRDYAKQ